MIPLEYRSYDWRENPDRPAIERIDRWLTGADEDHPWLVIYGEPGRGKTAMLCGIAAQIILRAEDSVLYRPMPDLLGEIRSTYDPDNPTSESEVIGLLKSVDWLMIDDVGAEIPTGWSGDRLYQITNHRHNERMRTVFASNYPPLALAEHVGDRIYGRLKRMAVWVPIECEDLRELAV